MGAKAIDDIPGKILRMLPGKRLAGDVDLLVATAHKVENISSFEVAMCLLDMLQTADCYVALLQGGVLSRIKEECWPEGAGMKFEKFLHDIGLWPPAGDAQIRLYNTLVESECSQADWELIGWIKLRVIAPFLTKENRAELIDLANSKSLPELMDHVKKKQSKASPCAYLLRDAIKEAGYREAMLVVAEIWPELEIEVYEP